MTCTRKRAHVYLKRQYQHCHTVVDIEALASCVIAQSVSKSARDKINVRDMEYMRELAVLKV